MVENKSDQPLCLRRFLEWYFKLVHSFDFIKKEWEKWKGEMAKPFDNEIEIYINDSFIKACKLEKHEMVFEFLNMDFQIYDQDFKPCELSEECCETFYNLL